MTTFYNTSLFVGFIFSLNGIKIFIIWFRMTEKEKNGKCNKVKQSTFYMINYVVKSKQIFFNITRLNYPDPSNIRLTGFATFNVYFIYALLLIVFV